MTFLCRALTLTTLVAIVSMPLVQYLTQLIHSILINEADMIKKSLCVALSGLILGAAAVAAPLELETQGSFAIGGSVVLKQGTFSEDHFLSPEGQKGLRRPRLCFLPDSC